MLVSTDELGGPIDQDKDDEIDGVTMRDVTVVDARSFSEYERGHISGAIQADLFAFHWNDTTDEGMRAFERQASRLFYFAGAGNHNKVVFYDNQSGMLAARGAWLGRYLGLDSHMLDGGLSKWKKEGRHIQQDTVRAQPSSLPVKADSSVIISSKEIQDNLDSLTIIDARTPDEYAGISVRAARGGHIPGAINIDWQRNLNADGTLKGADELARLYPFERDARIVTYCQGAYRAANTFVALKRLGFKDVRVYLGSWGEWGNIMGLPVSK